MAKGEIPLHPPGPLLPHEEKGRGWRPILILLALALGGCGLFGEGAPFGGRSQPLPTVVLEGGGGAPATAEVGLQPGQGGVIASGIVVPAEEAQMAFALAGKVAEVAVREGERVQAGQLLARLAGEERLVAAVEAAKLEVTAARQALEELSKDMDVRQAQAWEAYLEAREVYSDTLERRNNLASLSESPAAQEARAELEQAERLLRRVRAFYNGLPGDPQTNPEKARALFNLKMARLRRDLAQRKVDEIGEEPPAEELEKAEADLALAKARMEKAKRDFEAIQAGPDPDQVELAEARLATANAQLAASQAALADLELRASIAGTVTELRLHVGDWVNPGQVVARLSDLQELRVETTDLSERDVPRVAVGQPVTVYVKALEEQISGKVEAIAALADTLGGDVVYKVTIRLDEAPEGLRAGMSVEINFED